MKNPLLVSTSKTATLGFLIGFLDKFTKIFMKVFWTCFLGSSVFVLWYFRRNPVLFYQKTGTDLRGTGEIPFIWFIGHDCAPCLRPKHLFISVIQYIVCFSLIKLATVSDHLNLYVTVWFSFIASQVRSHDGSLVFFQPVHYK